MAEEARHAFGSTASRQLPAFVADGDYCNSLLLCGNSHCSSNFPKGQKGQLSLVLELNLGDLSLHIFIREAEVDAGRVDVMMAWSHLALR